MMVLSLRPRGDITITLTHAAWLLLKWTKRTMSSGGNADHSMTLNIKGMNLRGNIRLQVV